MTHIGDAKTKTVEYVMHKFRPDGTEVGGGAELTLKEYEYYKEAMPKRLKAIGKGYTCTFEKIPPKKVEYMDVFI